MPHRGTVAGRTCGSWRSSSDVLFPGGQVYSQYPGQGGKAGVSGSVDAAEFRCGLSAVAGHPAVLWRPGKRGTAPCIGSAGRHLQRRLSGAWASFSGGHPLAADLSGTDERGGLRDPDGYGAEGGGVLHSELCPGGHGHTGCPGKRPDTAAVRHGVVRRLQSPGGRQSRPGSAAHRLWEPGAPADGSAGYRELSAGSCFRGAGTGAEPSGSGKADRPDGPSAGKSPGNTSAAAFGRPAPDSLPRGGKGRGTAAGNADPGGNGGRQNRAAVVAFAPNRLGDTNYAALVGGNV